MTTKTAERKYPRYGLWAVLLICLAPSAWAGVYQHGTVVRMRMTDCLPVHHGFMMAMSGGAVPTGPEVCPEYTLISDKVVFVIVGRSSDQMIPLADVIDFRLHNNEMAVRIDDARRENKFGIKEMILRTEWDMVQKHITEQMRRAPRSSEDVPENNLVLTRPE
jgi:hypothetical protein